MNHTKWVNPFFHVVIRKNTFGFFEMQTSVLEIIKSFDGQCFLRSAL